MEKKYNSGLSWAMAIPTQLVGVLMIESKKLFEAKLGAMAQGLHNSTDV